MLLSAKEYNYIHAYCEREENPISIDKKEPQFSWKVENPKGICKQTSFHLIVAESLEELRTEQNLFWNVESLTDESRVQYAGNMLEPCKTYYWRVEVTYDESVTLKSPEYSFRTAMYGVDQWKALWIRPLLETVPKETPVIREGMPTVKPDIEDIKLGKTWKFRKDFNVQRKVKEAFLYASAKGAYLPVIDGKRVGTFELAPGHTDYKKRICYQVYDVTEFINVEGEHTLSAILSDGWFSGHIGFDGDNCTYGKHLSLLMQLNITYEDGTNEYVTTDESFGVEESAIIYSDIQVGEKVDGRRIDKKFFLPGYHCVKNAVRDEEYAGKLVACHSNQIQAIDHIQPVRCWKEADAWIFDFGKCIAGKVQIRLNQKCGQEIVFEHSETLDKNGKFVCNIREAYKDQKDIYICSGKKDEIFEPAFTYHGFRYVKMQGYDGTPDCNEICAVQIGSIAKMSGAFRCSNENLNILQRNIQNSQRANFVSIPTDCPTREKAGWTGDVQVYADTACFNQDSYNFFNAWLEDVRESQSAAGEIPIIVPSFEASLSMFVGIDSSAGWSDVIITLPYVMYFYYGDINILRDNYSSMKRWLGYMEYTAAHDNPPEIGENADEHLRYIWNTGFQFGDWLTPSVSINFETGELDMMQSAFATMEIVPTIFFAISTRRMEKIAHILGEWKDEERYRDLYAKIKDAFQKEFLDVNLDIKSDLQGVFVLALYADLLDGDARKKAERKLIDIIHKNGNKIDTGFLSTPYLMNVLTDINEEALACKILLNEECPSWLYEIKKGATSVWESWQAIFPDGELGYVSMAHYAFGCIGSFLYRYFGGLYCGMPGFKKIIIAPKWNSILDFAETEYESEYGRIVCKWKRTDDKLRIHLEIPANTEAVLQLKELNIEKNIIPGTTELEFSIVD